MKCYWAGCENKGTIERKGGLLCKYHYEKVERLPVTAGEVRGRTPEPYIGEIEKEEWDLTRDLAIRPGYKLLKGSI